MCTKEQIKSSAIVEELIKDHDDQVMAAHFRTSTHITTRPVTKLYPLEVQDRKQNNPTTLGM